MFVHISPEPDAVAETISTLKFAERVSTIELGAAKANKETGDVKELKEQIANLKAALSRKEEEVEHLSRSLTGSPETLSVKSAASTTSSPVHPALGAPKDISSGRRSSTEDVANIKGPGRKDGEAWIPLTSCQMVSGQASREKRTAKLIRWRRSRIQLVDLGLQGRIP